MQPLPDGAPQMKRAHFGIIGKVQTAVNRKAEHNGYEQRSITGVVFMPLYLPKEFS